MTSQLRPTRGDVAVRFDRVTKRFGETVALDEVSLSIGAANS